MRSQLTTLRDLWAATWQSWLRFWMMPRTPSSRWILDASHRKRACARNFRFWNSTRSKMLTRLRGFQRVLSKERSALWSGIWLMEVKSLEGHLWSTSRILASNRSIIGPFSGLSFETPNMSWVKSHRRKRLKLKSGRRNGTAASSRLATGSLRCNTTNLSRRPEKISKYRSTKRAAQKTTRFQPTKLKTWEVVLNLNG